MGLVFLLAVLALGFRSSLIAARKSETLRVLSIASRVIEPTIVDLRNGVLSRNSALGMIGGQLRSLARPGAGTDNYVFMIDYDGRDLEGPAIAAAESYPGPGAVARESAIPNLISQARHGEGFVRYRVVLPSGERRLKLSLVKGYEAEGFLIGTGFYLGDLNRSVLTHSLPTIMVAVMLSALLILLVAFSFRPFYLVFGRLSEGFAAMSANPELAAPVRVEDFAPNSEPRLLLEEFNRTAKKVADYEAERSTAQSVLRRENDEKKLLLQEIHHRVKNNLQVIVSLLNLQAGAKEQAGCRECIGEATGRIRSMATIHEILYESGDFSTLDFPAYAERIVKSAAQASAARCDLDLRLAPLRVGLDQAMPCGLILSESLTNSFKYGRSPDGRVRIRLLLREEGQGIFMEVADSGPGFPVAFLEGTGLQGLGRTLMLSLAEQAQGEIRFCNESGAVLRLTLNSI